jgi:hypothetical protein
MNYNLPVILEEMERKLTDFSTKDSLASRSAEITSTLQTINPGYNDFDIHLEVRVILKDKTLASLRTLMFLSYYLPNRNHGILLRFTISNYIKNNNDFMELEFPLKSIGHFRIYIAELVESRGPDYLFGNLLNKDTFKASNLLSLYRLKITRNFKTNKDRMPEKKFVGVGYSDKGTLAKDPRGGIYHFQLHRLQNEIENQRNINESTKLFLEGFLQ